MFSDLRLSRPWRLHLPRVFQNQVFAAIQICLLLSQTLASPVWMPQFLSGGTGRNIRHLPCVSRRTGEQGTCMFAYTCMKANGTHLGTCIDRFYFGSCCKLQGESDFLLENDINYPVLSNNKVTNENDPFLHPSVSTIVDAVKLGASSASTTKPSSHKPVIGELTNKPITSTDKIYVPISTSSSKLNKTESGIYNEGVKKPLTAVTETTPLTTTQQYFLSTFQVVHDNNQITTPTTPTTVFKTTSKPDVTNWTVTHLENFEKKTTTELPLSTVYNNTVRPQQKPVPTTTTKRPIRPPTKTTTRKPSTKKPTTAKPTKTTTSKPLVTTKKPSPTTKKPISSTVVYKPISTVTSKPTTTKPTKKPVTIKTTTTPPQTSPTLALLSTTSEVVFTKPGSDLESNQSVAAFSTFRPDLSPTTKPTLITGPGLTTFSYIIDKATTPSSSTISNEIVTEKTTSSSTIEAVEEQSNVIFQQAGTPGTSVATPETTVQFFPESSQPTKIPWVEILQNQPTTQPTSTSHVPTTATATDDTLTTHSTSFVPSFGGSLNMSDYTQVCGRRLYPESRVVGGEKSTFGKWPWQISLRQWRTSTYLHKCGAALLNENWAITAAHCVENVPPSDLLLRLGEHDLSTEEEPYGYQERRVQIVASHPQFDPRTFEYDLALLRFYEPVKFQPNIIPVCVPEDSTNFVGQTAHVTGWGRLYEDGPLPSVLQEVSVPVINNTICENMYRAAGYIEHIPDIFICAGWKKGGFDSCEGDSGGPMVIQRPDKRWLLAGVISWGIGCAEPNQPGVYTRISEFREWINQILQF